MRVVTSIALLTLVAGCGQSLARTPVTGSPDVIAQLAGSWDGEYSSAETGRSGSITFRLAAGSDTAFGDVVMIPRVMAEPGAAVVLPRAEQAAVVGPPAQILTIRFVSASPGRVSGTLDSYTDPDCGCTLITTFEGAVTGDRIEGTFTTRGGAAHPTQQGRWRADRKSR